MTATLRAATEATDILKVNNFDVLRILAATQVVLTHTVYQFGIKEPSYWYWLKLFPGVPIFFVISGFLISASYERNRHTSHYFRNRFLRIFPGLWCCILATVLASSILGFDLYNKQFAPWLFSQSIGLIYTPGFLKNFGSGSYNGSLWTIPIELQFYFLLPLLYFADRIWHSRYSVFILAWLFFLTLAVALHTESPGPETVGQKILRYTFLPHFYLFLTGVALQRTKAYRSFWIKGKGIYWLMGYIAIRHILPVSTAGHFFNMLLLSVCAISLAYTIPLIAAYLLRGNDLSYGVYIYHGLFINIFIELGLVRDSTYLFALVVLTYLSAYLSWRFVEKAALRIKKGAAPGHSIDGDKADPLKPSVTKQ